MKSTIIKHSIVIGGHKTSVSLEEPFWTGLKEIACGREITLAEVVETINAGRDHGNLSSTIRLFVLANYASRRADVLESADAKARQDNDAAKEPFAVTPSPGDSAAYPR